jgi:hypothetical protein
MVLVLSVQLLKASERPEFSLGAFSRSVVKEQKSSSLRVTFGTTNFFATPRRRDGAPQS